ncbi:MAG TPA: hypothetical protein PLP14_09795, partial [Chitinophagaceae bacterium]|nr:hypothetical protein [Chitinophagaceae bacterium]
GKKVESKMTEKPLHKKSTDIVPGRPDRIDHRMKGPKGEKIYIGSRGGRYYLDASGKRNYVEYKGNKKHK